MVNNKDFSLGLLAVVVWLHALSILLLHLY